MPLHGYVELLVYCQISIYNMPEYALLWPWLPSFLCYPCQVVTYGSRGPLAVPRVKWSNCDLINSVHCSTKVCG